jgi:hypothetical protein
MGTETFIDYWIGQEPTPPSPTLEQMPVGVDVVPLAFVTIDESTYELDFEFLCTTHSPEAIRQAIQVVQGRGATVQLSINDQRIASVPDVDVFVENVVQNVVAWGVEGIDIDFEPPFESETLLEVTRALRPALREALGGAEPLLTAPIYSPWLAMPSFLKSFAELLDFVTTMDYGLAEESIELTQQYMKVIGRPEAVAIGTICMTSPPPSPGGNNSLEEVAQMCHWEPPSGRKRGAMLYTFSYDVKTRARGGTGQGNGAYTKTIMATLP